MREALSVLILFGYMYIQRQSLYNAFGLIDPLYDILRVNGTRANAGARIALPRHINDGIGNLRLHRKSIQAQYTGLRVRYGTHLRMCSTGLIPNPSGVGTWYKVAVVNYNS